MTSRDRVAAALNHKEPDRPPLDLGGTINSSITYIAYRNLRSFLGLPPADEVRMISGVMQVVDIDEDVRRLLSIDTVAICPWKVDLQPGQLKGNSEFTDAWGVRYKPSMYNSEVVYYEPVYSPLSNITGLDELEKFCWPDPEQPGIFDGLQEKARRLKEETDYALVGHMGDSSIFQKAMFIRGMQETLMDTAVNPELFSAILEKILEIQQRRTERFLDAVGEYLDVMSVGDDLGTQNGPLISPAAFRNLIKPVYKKYFQLIKSKTKAKLHMHSCGSIALLLDDLIEIGVDAINPVQISAKNMEPDNLKARFGDRLVFWGGIDTQYLLPKGTPLEVENETRRIIEIMNKKGGYVLNSVHNIQWDVPPENIAAMCRAVRGN